MSSIELQEKYQLEFMKAALDGLQRVIDYLKEGNLNQHQLIECAKTALISNYDVKIVVLILTYIDDVKYVDPGEDTLIQIAASMGNHPAVTYLVMNYAEINLHGDNVLQPIDHAIIAGDYNSVSYLLMHGAFIDIKLQQMMEYTFPLKYDTLLLIYEKFQELYKSFKVKNIDFLTKYIKSGMLLTKSHWKHIKKVFPQHFPILNRLYSRIQFIKKIPYKYESGVEGLKSLITLGNLSDSLDMFDRAYNDLRKKHTGFRFSKSSGFKTSTELPELPKF